MATYVDFGGANYTRAVRAMELCLETPSKVILVVTFGTIARPTSCRGRGGGH